MKQYIKYPIIYKGRVYERDAIIKMSDISDIYYSDVLSKWFKQHYTDNNIHVNYTYDFSIDFIALINKIIPNPNEKLILDIIKKRYVRTKNREIWELFKNFNEGNAPTKQQHMEMCWLNNISYQRHDENKYSNLLLDIWASMIKISIINPRNNFTSDERYTMTVDERYTMAVDEVLGPDPHVLYQNHIAHINSLVSDKIDAINYFYANVDDNEIKQTINECHNRMCKIINLFDKIDISEIKINSDLFKVNYVSLHKILQKINTIYDISQYNLLYQIINHVIYTDDEKYELLKIIMNKIKVINEINEIVNEIVKKKSTKILQLFIDHNVDINSPDDEGTYPLHMAVSFENIAIIEMLIKNGANIECLDGENKTPLNIAIDINSFEITSILLKAGANSHHEYNSLDT
jgi:hypothetical protein